MAMQPQNPDVRAAELAFAMLRFIQPAAPPFPNAADREGREAGVDWFTFYPSGRKRRDEVVPFLVSLASPAALLPAISRGSVAVLLLDELEESRRSWLQKEMDNQRSSVQHCASTYHLTPESRILLEFAEEELLFSFANVERWGERYIVLVGWSMIPCGDSRADARIMLLGPGGLRAWGGSCPVPPRQ